jgi:NadR type nicotinamide-nucleotide adenylyltransferase
VSLRRIAILGAESTGKTTLAKALAKAYGAVWAPEFLREYVDRRGELPQAADMDAIARGQIDREVRCAQRAEHLLFCDTTLLMTVVYNQYYLNQCPEWIIRKSRQSRYDLYFLAGTDIPWTPDSGQRDGPAAREDVQRLIIDELQNRDLQWTELSGPLRARLDTAGNAIDGLFAASG